MREVGGRIVLMDFSGAHGIDDAASADPAGHAALHGAGAAGRRPGDAGERRLRDRRAAVLPAHRPPSGRGRDAGRPRGGARAASARPPARRAARPAGGAGARRRARHRRRRRMRASTPSASWSTRWARSSAPVRRAGRGLALPGLGGRAIVLAALGLGAALAALLVAAAVLAWRSGVVSWPAASRRRPSGRSSSTSSSQEPLRLDPTSNDARVSPDGRVVVFSAWANGTQLLYRRAIGSRDDLPDRRHRGRGDAVLVGRQPLRRVPRQRHPQAGADRRRPGQQHLPDQPVRRRRLESRRPHRLLAGDVAVDGAGGGRHAEALPDPGRARPRRRRRRPRLPSRPEDLHLSHRLRRQAKRPAPIWRTSSRRAAPGSSISARTRCWDDPPSPGSATAPCSAQALDSGDAAADRPDHGARGRRARQRRPGGDARPLAVRHRHPRLPQDAREGDAAGVVRPGGPRARHAASAAAVPQPGVRARGRPGGRRVHRPDDRPPRHLAGRRARARQSG